MHFAAGFIAGGFCVLVYAHFFNSKVQKIGDDIIAEFNKIKAKV